MKIVLKLKYIHPISKSLKINKHQISYKMWEIVHLIDLNLQWFKIYIIKRNLYWIKIFNNVILMNTRIIKKYQFMLIKKVI